MGQSNPYGRDFSGQPMSTTSVDNLVPASPNATQSGASQSTRQDYSPLSEGWASKYNILGHHQYLDMDDDDPDDKLHDMNAKEEGFADSGCTWLSLRGFLNVLGMLLIVAALVGLFVGYPLYTYIEEAARDSGARGWNVVSLAYYPLDCAHRVR